MCLSNFRNLEESAIPMEVNTKISTDFKDSRTSALRDQFHFYVGRLHKPHASIITHQNLSVEFNWDPSSDLLPRDEFHS